MPSQEDYLDQLLKEMESGLNDDIEEEDASEIDMSEMKLPDFEAVTQGTMVPETVIDEPVIPEETLSRPAESDEIKVYESEVSESEPVIFETEPEESETESEAYEVESEAPEVAESEVLKAEPEALESEPEILDAESEMPETEFETPEAELGALESGIADTEMPEIDLTGVEKQEYNITESEPEKAEATDDFDMSDMDELLQFAKDMSEEDDDETDDAMSEEEIEKLLNQSRLGDAAENQSDAVSENDMEQDLMNLLNDASSESDDLQDIHDMLQKSDNNEAVDASVLEVPGDGMNPWENGTFGEGAEENGEDEFAGMSERQKKALLKKREKEEKAAQKKAEKEAKKAEKLAKKAEKEAAKKAAKEAKKQTASARANGENVGSDMAAPEMAENVVSEMAAFEEPASETGETPSEEADGLEFSQAEIDALLGGGDVPVVEPSSDKSDSPQDESESASEEKGDKKEKKSLIARIIEFLTEEDEDEEEGKSGTEDIPLSDENKNILEEMDQEDKGKKGKKGKKPKKDKKGKDAKNADDGDEDEEGGSGKGKDKKKPKKEKKPKPVKEKEPVDPKNRITFKKLLPVILTCVSLLLAAVLLVYLGGDFLVKQEARRAFYQEDYETCYQELYGKKLSETEQVMLGKSESILRIRLWMREYELFAEEGSEVEALDVLIQAANDYSELYEYAQKWNAQGDISVIYGQMLEILSNKYRLSEAQALEIAAEPDDVEYTRKVTTAANGGGYTSAGQGSASVDLPDMLPEEKQFPENSGGR